jgi:hypothetical protein
VLHPGNREEKVPCSASTPGGVGAASSVPKSNGTKLGKAREPEEENPAPRIIKTEKKEEKLSANPAKKIHQKKIHSQPPVLYSFYLATGRPLLDKIVNDEIYPSFVITQRLNLEQALDAYRTFLKRKDGGIKVILKPWNLDAEEKYDWPTAT